MVAAAGAACRARTPAAPAVAPTYDLAWQLDLGSSATIAMALGPAAVFAGSPEGPLDAFALADGHRVWSAPGGGERLVAGARQLFALTPSASSTAAASRGTATIRALAQDDGHEWWHTAPLGEPVVGPIVGDDALWLAADGDLLGLTLSDGLRAWRMPLEAPATALAVDGRRVFVALASGPVRCFDTRTHALLWQATVDARITSLAAGHGRVAATADDGSLLAFSEAGGSDPLWRVRHAAPVGTAAVGPANVYVAQFDNTARAYNAGNGTERWRIRLAARPAAGVLLAGPQVFVPLLDGAIATCPGRTGEPAGEIPVAPGGPADAAAETRLAASAVANAGALIVRVTRPASHTAWTLSALTRKAGGS